MAAMRVQFERDTPFGMRLPTERRREMADQLLRDGSDAFLEVLEKNLRSALDNTRFGPDAITMWPILGTPARLLRFTLAASVPISRRMAG